MDLQKFLNHRSWNACLPPNILKIQTGANHAIYCRWPLWGYCWVTGEYSGIKHKPNSLFHFFPIHWHFDTSNPIWPQSDLNQNLVCVSSLNTLFVLSAWHIPQISFKTTTLSSFKCLLKSTRCSLKHNQLIMTNKNPFSVTSVQITGKYWLE